MKKIFMFIAIAVITIFLSAYAHAEEKKTIAVTINAATYTAKTIVADVYENITDIIVNDGRYDVVERHQLNPVINELGFHQSGMVDEKTVIDVGQLTGAQYMLIGNILNADVIDFNNLLYNGAKAKIKFSYKIIDNRTGKIIDSDIINASSSMPNGRYTYRHSGQDRALLHRAVKKLSNKIIDSLNK